MSTYIELQVTVTEHDPANEAAIIEAIHEGAPFTLDSDNCMTRAPGTHGADDQGCDILDFSGTDSCSYGSVTDEALKEAFLKPILEANGGKKCAIEARVTWLENCPYETFYICDPAADEEDEPTAEPQPALPEGHPFGGN